MAEPMTKLEKLEQQINSAAALEAKRILDDAEKRAKAMIDDENERMAADQGTAARSKLSRFENDERKRVSESRYAADRKVLLHRNALVDSLFDEIRDEISAFTASDKYKAHLTACAERADRAEKLDSTVCVYCRRSDVDTVGAVTAKYGVTVAADRNISLGGLIFKYPEKGIFIDLTLDTAFTNEREAFSARSEMQL